MIVDASIVPIAPIPVPVVRIGPTLLPVERVQPVSVPVLTTGPRGYSAYQIAVQQGFVGSEAEWLESLNGAQGEGLVLVAGENLSAGRAVVKLDGLAYYYQPSEATHAGKVVGITRTSGSLGASVTISSSGRITDASFAGLENQVLWVGADGELQTSIPLTGNVQKAGIGIGNNQVFIDFSIQIIR